jgi:hypothetical protein
MAPDLKGTSSRPSLGLLSLGTPHATAKGCLGLLPGAARLVALLPFRIFDLKGCAVALTCLILWDG